MHNSLLKFFTFLSSCLSPVYSLFYPLAIRKCVMTLSLWVCLFWSLAFIFHTFSSLTSVFYSWLLLYDFPKCIMTFIDFSATNYDFLWTYNDFWMTLHSHTHLILLSVPTHVGLHYLYTVHREEESARGSRENVLRKFHRKQETLSKACVCHRFKSPPFCLHRPALNHNCVHMPYTYPRYTRNYL